MYKLSVFLNEDGKEKLAAIAAKLDTSVEEVFERAIALYDLAVDQVEQGYILCFMDRYEKTIEKGVAGIIAKGKI